MQTPGHVMKQSRVTNIALYAIAALLLANLVAMLCRSEGVSLLPAALAQRQAPIAGGAGLFVMPAQLSANQWGCYLMDVDRGTLCVYQYQPGSIRLQFVAARNFTNDLKLANFNTLPTPREIGDLVSKQEQAVRGPASTAPAGDEAASRDNN